MAWRSRKKQLNLKLVVGALLSVVVFFLGLALLNARQKENLALLMLERAEAAMQEQKYDVAIRCYRYYVNYRPDDSETFGKLAMLLADQARVNRGNRQELSQVYPMLEEAVMRDPENMDLLRRLADLMVELGRLSAATDHYLRLTKAFPDDMELQFRLGRCLAAAGDAKRAAEAFQAALTREPTNITAYVELAELLRGSLGQRKEAEGVIQRMVSANPRSARAILERARYWWRSGERVQAAAELKQALAMAPDDVEALLLASEVAIGGKQYDDAQRQLERAKRLFPNDDRVDQWLVTLRSSKGELEDAITLLEKLIAKNPDDFRALMTLADLQTRRGDLIAARSTIRRMRSAHISRLVTDFHESYVLIQEKKWAEASVLLERLRVMPRKTPDQVRQIEMVLARCYEHLDLPDRQLEAYERVLAIDPGIVAARMGRSIVQSRLGRAERALDECRTLIRGMGLAEFAKIPALRSNYYQLFSIQMLRTPAEQRDWSELERFVRMLDEIPDVDRVEISLMRVDLLLNQGKAEEARRLIVQVQQQNPKDGRLRNAMARLIATQDPEKALALTELQSPAIEDSIDLRLTRIGLAVGLGAVRGAVILKELEQSSEKFSEEDRLKLWRRLGMAYYQLGDRQQMKRFWRRVLEVQPDDRQMRETMFESAREIGDEAGMIEAIDGFARQLGTQSPEWRFFQASRLVWQVRNRQMDRQLLLTANRYLKQAVVQRPRWMNIPCLEAEIDVIDGRLDDAILNFRRASELGALSPANLGQYARLLYVYGRYDEAREIVSRLSAESPSPATRMLSSELAMRSGNKTVSLQQAGLIASESRNPIDFLWYGQLLGRAGRKDDAELAFRRAVALGPLIPEAWLALISQLHMHEKDDQAEVELRKAQVALPEDRVPLVIAEAFEALGKLKQAREYYLAAAALHPDNVSVLRQTANYFLRIRQTRQAAKYLAELVRVGTTEPKERPTTVWARRMLAGMIAAEGDFLQQEQALALLSDNAVDGRLGVEDVQLQAAILASRPIRQSQLRAIALLEQLRKEYLRLRPTDQFLLAQLYEQTGRWNLAQPLLESLLKSAPSDPAEIELFVQFQVRYLQLALRHDVPLRAIQPWLEILERKSPRDPRTVGIKAQVLAKEGQLEDAIGLAKQLVPRPLPSQEVGRLQEAAEILEQIKQYESARQLMAEYAEKVPQGRLSLAAFLARRGAIPEALDQCEKALAQQPAIEVLSLAVGVLRTGGARPEDFRRVQGWFEKIRREATDSRPYLLQWANFLDLQGRYPELVRLYREFLDRDDVSDRDKAVAANNLVYVLALQKEGPKEALTMIDRAIQVLGPSPQLRDTRALALLANGQSSEAIEELKRAIADNPTGVNYFHLALAHAAANDLPSAGRALEAARKDHRLDPDAMTAIERQRYQDLLNKLGPM